MKKRLYIAYGSNLNLEQMKHRCPTATVVGKSELKDYTLAFKGRSCGVATIEPKKGSTVPVLIWDIKPFDEERLDNYEGYPIVYEKQDIQLELDGKSVSAMAYVMTPYHKFALPAERYIDTIKEGYLAAGFDLKVLEKFLQETDEMIKQEQSEENPMTLGW